MLRQTPSFSLLTSTALVAVFGMVTTAHAQAPVYASPQEVVDACRAAHARHDVAAELDCYGPTGQRTIATMLMRFAFATPTTRPAGGAVDPEKAAFEAKYGLDHRQQKPGESPAAFAERLAAELPDLHAFLLDFMKRQQAHAATRPARQPASQPSWTFEDLTIDPAGTAASATLTQRDNAGGTMSQTVKFEKVDGGWKLASPMAY